MSYTCDAGPNIVIITLEKYTNKVNYILKTLFDINSNSLSSSINLKTLSEQDKEKNNINPDISKFSNLSSASNGPNGSNNSNYVQIGLQQKTLEYIENAKFKLKDVEIIPAKIGDGPVFLESNELLKFYNEICDL